MRNRIRAALNTRSGDVNGERATLESQKDEAPAISDLPSLSPDMLKSVEAALALLDLLDSDSEGAWLPDSADPGNQDI
jgi:hypothetical protein